MPACSAALPATTSPISAGVKGWPTVMKNPASTTIANKKFAIGPAATISVRCDRRLWKKETAFSSSVIFSTVSLGIEAASASPNIFTYPPIGIRLSFQRVPVRSVQPNSSGPKPMEKIWTLTPLRRAEK